MDVVNDGAANLDADPIHKPKNRKITYHNENDLHSAVTKIYFDEAFQNLKGFCESLVKQSEYETPKNDFDAMISVISAAKNLETIVNASPYLEMVYENNLRKGIKCQLCFQENESLGLFHFLHTEEVYSQGKSNKPALTGKFKGLRSIVRSHLLSNNHGRSIRRLVQNEASPIATMAYVETKIEDIKRFLENLISTVIQVKTPEVRKVQSEVTKATSILQILETCPNLKLLNQLEATENVNAFDGVGCVPCRSDAVKKKPETKSKLGIFSYDCSVGTDFSDPKKNQPKLFRHLKDKISNHLTSRTHCTAANIPYVQSQKEKSEASKNETVGLILGKVAYKAIVKYQSKKSFEDEITFLADIGVDVGEINHSVDYVNKLFPELYSVLKEQTMTVLHQSVAPYLQSSPFVVFADKITPYGTTQQIIGIIIFRNGKNTPIVLDVLPVKHKIQNGAALAQDIVDTLHKFYTPQSAKELYVGCSFDGQYIALKVPQEILRLLGFQIDSKLTKEEQNQTLFHSYSWDPAHLLELACGDVKKSKLHEWVDNTEQIIVSINQGNTYGKAYLRLIEEARQMDLVLMRPGSFSDTRFSSYKFRVLNRFANNYPMLYNTYSQDLSSDLNRFNNCEFCIRLSGLIDIFELIGATSAQIQSSELLPWECDSIIEDCITNLREMAISINNQPFVPSVSWKSLSAAVEEINNHGTFKGKAVLIRKSVYYVTRSKSVIVTQDQSFQIVIDRVIAEIKFFVSSLSESISKRYTKNNAQKTFVVARNSFSRTEILERSLDNVPDSFVDYCNLARNWGFLDAGISQESVNTQYLLFCRKVKEEYNYQMQTFGLLVPESSQYWKIMTSDCDRENFATILNLLLTSMVRNKSECIAESIGSMMKVHLDKRFCLSDKNLGMEIFLHFNGPKPNRDSNGLIKKANIKLFGKDKLHFYRRSNPSDLKFWEDHSKVIAKIHSETGRINVPDE